MTEPRNGRTSVRYYCTAGNGMEHFLIEEVKKKLAAESVCQMPGKVLFSSSVEISRVCELKAAERLFLLLKQDSPVSLTAHMNPAKAASVLQAKLLGDRDQWTSAVMTWRRLQGELAHRKTPVNTASPPVAVTTKGERRRGSEEGEKCNVESRKGPRGQIEERSGARTPERKRKRDDEDDEEEERRAAAQIHSDGENVEKERTSEGEKEKALVLESFSCRKNGVTSGADFDDRDHTVPGLDYHVESNTGKVDDLVEDAAVRSAESVTATRGKDKTRLQPSRTSPDPPPLPVSFRISCKCTGSLSRYFSTQEVSKIIGVGLSRLLGWKTDLKNPQLEVNVYLSDDYCLLGIPLTRLPLANRCYIKTTGLRSTVAWAMASLAQIQPGSCVVDPMCGVGTILLEAAQEHKAACFVGVDIDDGQLWKANENIEFAELGNRIHLLKASSMMLPLPNASADAVVCDLPFGRKFGAKTNMAANLPLILTEMERVLCVGGTLVLLLSPQLSCLLKKLLAQKGTETSNQETNPLKAQDCLALSSSSPRQETFQIHKGINSLPTQKTGTHSELQRSLAPLLPSLKHQATLRVSLGLIDGLIHKYVKISV